MIVTLDDLGVNDLVRILREPRNSLIGQFRKILKHHGADLEFTDGAIREFAGIAHERGTGARELRAIVERLLEPILFDPEPWITYRVTEASVRGGGVEAFGLFDDEAAPLRRQMARRARG